VAEQFGARVGLALGGLVAGAVGLAALAYLRRQDADRPADTDLCVALEAA
jgi:hypothetical protein